MGKEICPMRFTITCNECESRAIVYTYSRDGEYGTGFKCTNKECGVTEDVT